MEYGLRNIILRILIKETKHFCINSVTRQLPTNCFALLFMKLTNYQPTVIASDGIGRSKSANVSLMAWGFILVAGLSALFKTISRQSENNFHTFTCYSGKSINNFWWTINLQKYSTKMLFHNTRIICRYL